MTEVHADEDSGKEQQHLREDALRAHRPPDQRSREEFMKVEPPSR
jgi:hypothetical protein